MKSGRAKTSYVRRSLVWMYFDVDDPGLVKCRLCEKLIKRSGGNTTNLAMHLRSSHVKQYDAMLEEGARRKGATSSWKWVSDPEVRAMPLLPLLPRYYSLQCFDTVGWAEGRASNL